jgi:hypothetical protein
MGMSYSSIAVMGPTQEAIAKYLEIRHYIVHISPTIDGCTVVWEEFEALMDRLFDLASDLSTHFACPVLGALVHDSDVLYFQLFENGAQTDEYNSHPSFGINEEPRPPTGGDAHRLCTIFGVPGAETEVERILRHNWWQDQSQYLFAEDRHADLIRAFRLPPFASHMGYTDVEDAWDDEQFDRPVTVGESFS